MRGFQKISFLSFILITLHPCGIASGRFAPSVKTTKQDTQALQQTPELVYEYRLAELGLSSPVEFDYNEEVKHYIEIYTGKRRAEFEKILDNFL